MKFAESLKAYAALVGSVLTALSATTGVVPDGAKIYVALGLAVATAVTTWKLPNATPPSVPASEVAAYVAPKDDVISGTPVVAGQLVAGDAVKAIPTGHPVDVTMAGPSPYTPVAPVQ